MSWESCISTFGSILLGSNCGNMISAIWNKAGLKSNVKARLLRSSMRRPGLPKRREGGRYAAIGADFSGNRIFRSPRERVGGRPVFARGARRNAASGPHHAANPASPDGPGFVDPRVQGAGRHAQSHFAELRNSDTGPGPGPD